MQIHKEISKQMSAKTASNIGGKTMPSQSPTVVQAQLETTTPGDTYEQEADRMADMVMRKIDGANTSEATPSNHCPTLTISCFGGTSMPISSQMESQLQSMQGGGHAMPEGLRVQMEGSFGHDFSNVRLHTDSAAADMSSSINAKAFTHGNDIYFNQGQFQPNTAAGQHLIAHELTHTVQQGGKVAREEEENRQGIEEIKKYRYDMCNANGITVIICGSYDGDHNGAYKKITFGEDLFKQKNVITIQSPYEEVDEIETELKHIVDAYGPLRNLIIIGHGRWNRIKISENHNLTISKENKEDYKKSISFFKTVKKLMDDSRAILSGSDSNQSSQIQSIYLLSCLTNSHFEGEKNIAEEFSDIIGPNVKFYASKAEVEVRSQKTTVTEDGTLSITDNEDNKNITRVDERKSYDKNEIEYSGDQEIGLSFAIAALIYKILQDKPTYSDVEKIEPLIDTTEKKFKEFRDVCIQTQEEKKASDKIIGGKAIAAEKILDTLSEIDKYIKKILTPEKGKKHGNFLTWEEYNMLYNVMDGLYGILDLYTERKSSLNEIMNPYVNGTYDLKRINENSGEYLLRRIIYNLK